MDLEDVAFFKHADHLFRDIVAAYVDADVALEHLAAVKGGGKEKRH
jgi:hypothetical protein